jgi:SulP family sulfate permease
MPEPEQGGGGGGSQEGGGKRKGRGWFRWNDAFTPKSIVCLREGYGREFILRDILAGLTVAIIALPLSMALAIGSHVKPEQGLYTAIIAGFLISLLGGSRVQVGGPAGAFMAMVAGIVDMHGMQGLAICTLMAGVILMIMGFAKLGSLIKFIPYPVTTGFTSGIAIIIFSSQVQDFLGLTIRPYTDFTGHLHEKGMLPSDFLGKWEGLIRCVDTLNWKAAALGIGSLVIMGLMRKYTPRIPGAIIVVVGSALLVSVLGLAASAANPAGIETVGTRFGGIPQSLPAPKMPIALSSWADVQIAWSQAQKLIGSATTLAILCAIESLLCAVVADGMIGGRHKPNCELVAQGIGNIGSTLFGGVPATGVIARTAANVKNGGRTPLAGMVHSVTLLVLMLLLAPYASLVPLSVLAAILVVVAWNMAERDHFRSILRAPRSDAVVLLTTFGLTVLTDLTTAVGVGMVLAAILFMKRMSEVTNVALLQDDDDARGDDIAEAKDPNAISKRAVPPGVDVYEINGPFFFGVADRLKDTLRGLEKPPKVFILRMRRVPAIDATGMHALDEFYEKCSRQGTLLLLAGVHAQPMFAMTQYGLIDRIGDGNMFENLDDALTRAGEIVGVKPVIPALHEPEVARERERIAATRVLPHA